MEISYFTGVESNILYHHSSDEKFIQPVKCRYLYAIVFERYFFSRSAIDHLFCAVFATNALKRCILGSDHYFYK